MTTDATITADGPPAATPTSATHELFGHPKGLFICFLTELWERFSFYGMKYLLVLYLVKYHLFSDAAGLDVLGAYAGLVYALPVIGGLLADRYLGMRKAVVFGGILLALGHLLMAVEGDQAVAYAAGTVLSQDIILANGSVLAAGATLSEDLINRDVGALNVFYFALALIVMGVGYLKPNISTIVGKLYGKDDARRDAGFTIFYMGINIGSFTATLLCGWLGETYGWGYGFGAAGIGMVLGLITFLWGQKYLYGHADPIDAQALKAPILGPINREWSIYILSLPALGVLWYLLQSEPVVHLTQNGMLIVSIIGIVLFSMVTLSDKTHRLPAYLLALLSLTLLAAVIVEETKLFGDGITLGIVYTLLGIATISLLAMHINFGRSRNRKSRYAVLTTDLIVPIAAALLYVLASALLWLTTGEPIGVPTSHDALLYLGIGSLIGFFIYGFLVFNSPEYGRTVVLMVLILSTIVFWALFEQSAGSMTLYADRVVDRNIFGVEFVASQFGSLNAGFIILLAIPFAALWVWLSKRNLEPNTPVKFSLGILQAGLGFGALVLGAQFPNDLGQVAAIWLILAYLLHTTGELCLSPVGLSAVTKLSIPKVVGVSMGTWFLATALSETVATRMGKMAAIDVSGNASADIASTLATYTELYQFLMWVGIAVGIVMLFASPFLKRGMHGIH